MLILPVHVQYTDNISYRNPFIFCSSEHSYQHYWILYGPYLKNIFNLQICSFLHSQHDVSYLLFEPQSKEEMYFFHNINEKNSLSTMIPFDLFRLLPLEFSTLTLASLPLVKIIYKVPFGIAISWTVLLQS